MRYNHPILTKGVETIWKIELTVEEFNENEIIKELADHGSNKNTAALMLGCTRCTIDRHIAGYKSESKAYYIHGNCSKIATLHIAIDDATGIVVGGWFEEQETLCGYYSVFRQILTKYGIP